jgi:signal transduction histidine kinase
MTKLALITGTYHPGGAISRQESKVEAAVFAIVQEAVTNGLKHADASRIDVRLRETPNMLHVSVVDDGKGFEVGTVMRYYEHGDSLGMLTSLSVRCT